MDRPDRAIEQARAAFATTDDRTDPYAYFFSAGQLASTESVRNLALTSLHLGMCHLYREKPDVERGAAAVADAVRLSAHNRSARLVEQLKSSWRELAPWQEEPAVKAVRDQMACYGVG